MSAQKPKGTHLSRPHRPFWGPLAAIFDFAGGEQVPSAPLGWYFLFVVTFKLKHEIYLQIYIITSLASTKVNLQFHVKFTQIMFGIDVQGLRFL